MPVLGVWFLFIQAVDNFKTGYFVPGSVLHLRGKFFFPGVVDEIDPDVFFSYAGPLVHLIGYPLIEFFLHLNGPTADPRN